MKFITVDFVDNFDIKFNVISEEFYLDTILGKQCNWRLTNYMFSVKPLEQALLLWRCCYGSNSESPRKWWMEMFVYWTSRDSREADDVICYVSRCERATSGDECWQLCTAASQFPRWLARICSLCVVNTVHRIENTSKKWYFRSNISCQTLRFFIWHFLFLNVLKMKHLHLEHLYWCISINVLSVNASFTCIRYSSY